MGYGRDMAIGRLGGMCGMGMWEVEIRLMFD